MKVCKPCWNTKYDLREKKSKTKKWENPIPLVKTLFSTKFSPRIPLYPARNIARCLFSWRRIRKIECLARQKQARSIRGPGGGELFLAADMFFKFTNLIKLNNWIIVELLPPLPLHTTTILGGIYEMEEKIRKSWVKLKVKEFYIPPFMYYMDAINMLYFLCTYL